MADWAFLALSRASRTLLTAETPSMCRDGKGGTWYLELGIWIRNGGQRICPLRLGPSADPSPLDSLRSRERKRALVSPSSAALGGAPPEAGREVFEKYSVTWYLAPRSSTVNGQRSTVNGQRSTVNGQRSTPYFQVTVPSVGTSETQTCPGGTTMISPLGSVRRNQSVSDERRQRPSMTLPSAKTKALPEPIVTEVGTAVPPNPSGGYAVSCRTASVTRTGKAIWPVSPS